MWTKIEVFWDITDVSEKLISSISRVTHFKKPGAMDPENGWNEVFYKISVVVPHY